MRKTARFMLLASLVGFSACTSVEEEIKKEIDKANYCESPRDCVDVGGKCPFDCAIVVNAREAERIRALVDGFESKCMYSCTPITGVKCERQKCSAVLAMPSAAEGGGMDRNN